MTEESAPGEARVQFVTTQWSMVLAAGGRLSHEQREALERLCRAYWYPLYAYVRRTGNDPEEAKDLTQGFLANLLEKGALRLADRERGRFRTFLLTALKHYLVDEVRRKNAAKRGGGQLLERLEWDDGEQQYGFEPADPAAAPDTDWGQSSITCSPDGNFVAVISGPMLKLLDYRGHRELKTLSSPDPKEEFRALAFSPADTNILATTAGRTLMLWDLARGQISTSTTLSHPGDALALSPDGVLLAANGTGSLELFRLPALSRTQQLLSRQFESPDSVVAFAPDGRSVITSGGVAGNPLEWDLVTGKAHTFEPQHKASLAACLFSSDANTLVTAAADSRIVFWDIHTRSARKVIVHSGGDLLALGLSHDGRFLLTGAADEILLWDAATGQPERLYRGHKSGVNAVFFAPGGQSIISSADDGTVKVWDRTSTFGPEIIFTNKNWSSTVSFSPDGRKLATTDLQQGTLAVLDGITGAHITNLTENTEAYAGPSALFSPDGRWLVRTGHDRLLRIWDASTLAFKGALTNDFAPNTLSFSANGRILGVAGIDGFGDEGLTNRLAFWDLEAQRRLKLLPEATPNAACVCFGRQHPVVAVGYMNGEVRLWNYETGRFLHGFREQNGRIWFAAMSSNDHWLAAGDRRGGLVFYNLHTNEALRSPAASSSWVMGLAFSPDDRTLASAEGDGVIRLWNVATRRCALELRAFAGKVSKVAFSPDGNLLASCGADGKVRLWRASSLAEIDAQR